MAVGKGSMERAAKTVEKAQKAESKKTPAKRTAKPKAAAIAAPAEEVMEKIIGRSNDGILARDAMPNERFGVGDAMPVYYF